MLKLIGLSISLPLSLLFNLSFSTGIFPTAWEAAVVIPLYKNKGARTDATNYRPISLLSTISKLCERIIYDKLYAHVDPHLHQSQSALRRGDSTAWQLLRVVQSLHDNRHRSEFSLVCFFDISKAFDTVWHRGLMAKIASFSIQGRILRWLESYLCCRSQQVNISGQLSQPERVCSGVPQGSILGPLLF